MADKTSILGRTLFTRVLAFSIPLVLIFASVILIFTFKEFRDRVNTETDLVLDQGSMVIKQFINLQFSHLETLASTRAMIEMDLEPTRLSLESLLRDNPEFLEIALVSPSGREVLHVSGYEFISPEQPTFHEVHFHFREAMVGARSQSDIVFNEGRYNSFFSVPVKRSPVEIVGVLVAKIDLRFLSEWIGQISLEKTGIVYIVDKRSGKIIAHPEPEFTLRQTDAMTLPPVNEALLSGRETKPYGPHSRHKNLLGKRVVTGARYINNPGWVLVVEKEERELLFYILPLFLSLSGAGLLMAATGFLWYTRQVRSMVTEPISRLSTAMYEFETGKAPTALNLERKDEIGDLSRAFSEITESLSSTLQELRLSRSKLNIILENIPQGVFLVNSKFQVEYANATMGRELNKLSGDSLGLDVRNLISPAFYKIFEEEWERMKKEMKPFSIEMEYLTGRGKFEPGIIFTAPIPGLDGAFIEAVLLGVNLTKVKEAEEKRTREARLAFLGLLAAKISHELRSPLSAMGNSIYYLKKNLKNSDEKINRHLDMLERQVEVSSQLISSILDFARPKEPVFYPVSLNEVLHQALERAPLPSNIEMEQTLDPGLPPVQGDALLLVQVFINLLTNACQAMPEGGKISLRSLVKEDMVVVEVQDTGKGIEPEFMKNLFKPFHSGKARGMGLGLTISKDTVEKHGGRIEVRSQAGQGTAFSVYLPLKGRNLS